MIAGPIRSILSQQDKALYSVKKKIREQGDKTVTKVKEKLPSESEIKSKFKAQASSALCSANGLNKSKKAYDKIKALTDSLKKIVDGAEKALNKIKSVCEKILSAVQKILSIISKIAALIAVLSTVVTVAKGVLTAIGSIILPPAGGVLLPPGVAVFLKDKLDYAAGIIEMIKATVKSIPKLLEKYIAKAKKYLGYILKAIAALAALKNFINFIIGLLETLYMGMLAQCGSFSANNDPTDGDGNVNTNNPGSSTGGSQGGPLGGGAGADGSAGGIGSQAGAGSQTPDDFLNNIGFTSSNINGGADPLDYSDSLAEYYEEQLALLTAQGNTEIIEKIYNANFEMLGYRRYKV